MLVDRHRVVRGAVLNECQEPRADLYCGDSRRVRVVADEQQSRALHAGFGCSLRAPLEKDQHPGWDAHVLEL